MSPRTRLVLAVRLERIEQLARDLSLDISRGTQTESAHCNMAAAIKVEIEHVIRALINSR